MSRREVIRVCIPDSHGAHIDWSSAKACAADIKSLQPKEIVLLGDHLDCGGTFNSHQRSYTSEIAESYGDDIKSANTFLDMIQRAAPRADYHYLEGNHEWHVERWSANSFSDENDAASLLEVYGPQSVLELKQRGIKYYKRSEFHMGVRSRGAIRLGKCFFVHGVSHARHAAAEHIRYFGGNVVFGHTHRVDSRIEPNVSSGAIGAWSFGTLAQLAPLYGHTRPTSWSHGYGIQFVRPNGIFTTISIPIVHGISLLPAALKSR